MMNRINRKLPPQVREQFKQILCSISLVIMVPLMTIPLISQEIGTARQGPSMIPFSYQSYAGAVGTRFCIAGKERITAAGKLSRYVGGRERTEAVTVTWQFPLQLRLDLPDAVLTYDVFQPGQLLPQDSTRAEAMQVLLQDSVEGFVVLGGKQGSSRNLGSGYRLPDAKPEDSCMDIIHAVYPDAFRNGKTVDKAYWSDCRTKLLGVVTYPSLSGARIHVIVDDWRDIGGEKVPFRIERREDGKLTMRLTLDNVVISSAAKDGAFGGN
jgi:hypothetical protein